MLKLCFLINGFKTVVRIKSRTKWVINCPVVNCKCHTGVVMRVGIIGLTSGPRFNVEIAYRGIHRTVE